jgi:hypothetical protein
LPGAEPNKDFQTLLAAVRWPASQEKSRSSNLWDASKASEAAPQTNELYVVARLRSAFAPARLRGLAYGGTEFLLKGKSIGAISMLRLSFLSCVLAKVL